jgi:hypothetical protein
MKLVRFAFCFALTLFAFSQFVSAQDGGKLYVEDELLVKFKSGTASAAARSVNAEIGASLLEEFPDLGWQRVKLPADSSVSRAILDYKKFADIEEAQPNFYYHMTVAPNDALRGALRNGENLRVRRLGFDDRQPGDRRRHY